jgi:hypothetical protein
MIVHGVVEVKLCTLLTSELEGDKCSAGCFNPGERAGVGRTAPRAGLVVAGGETKTTGSSLLVQQEFTS